MATLLIRHIASGQAFFSGVIFLLIAASLGSRNAKRTATLTCGLGLLLVIVSATPLSPIYCGLAGIITFAWLVLLRRTQKQSSRDDVEDQRPAQPSRIVTGLFVGVWVLGVAFEIPHHLLPEIPPASAPRLTIFADSVTAGMGENEAVTWPNLFAKAYPIEVIDHSRMGATAGSATVLAVQHPPQPGIVLLEIGGNDILGSTSVEEYERTLRTLLESVSGKGQQVVMFELPLPPFFNSYGRVQRRQATEYDVALIPKRVLLNVLLSEETTLDSIHLSQAGHEQMADVVWDLLEDSYGIGQGPISD
jgi:acyl-CoA thioesterase-1